MGRYFDERRALPAQKGQFPKKWRRPLERDDKRARRRLESPFGQNHGNVSAALDKLGVPRRLRRARLRNPRILQMTSLAFDYSHFVPQQKQGMASRRLESLEDKAKAHAEWYRRNNALIASYRFLAMVFGAWIAQNEQSA